MHRLSLTGLAWLPILIACAPGAGGEAEPELRSRTDPEPAQAVSSAPVVVFLGDSLSAGLGLEGAQAFPALLERRMAARGSPIRLINAGVSGDTTAGGLRRLDWLLQQSPDLMVVELGANDGLRGLPLAHSEENLRQIVKRSLVAGSQVLLLGMLVPPNYGEPYASDFAGIFPRLAAELDVALVPFLLDGVAGRPELNLPDGIHPTAAGHERMAETVLPLLAELVDGWYARRGDRD